MIGLLLGLGGLTPAAAAPGATGDRPAGFVEITPKSRRAVDRGLAFLARSQAKDGSWGADAYPQHVGITALACLAFMAEGHLPERGRYGDRVRGGLEFILNHATASGLIAADTSHGPMYGHGFATLFLGEIYGMTASARRRQRVREVLLKAVRLIVNSQNPQGGWRYQPIPIDADISVTICQIMGLRSARNAGIHVPQNTIQKAIGYVKACQNPEDGGFRYMIQAGGSAFPRSAAGVASLYYAGVYRGRALERGLAYLMDHLDAIEYGRGSHYFYGQYYASQAMFLAGGESWRKWYPRLREELLAHQNEDGSWSGSHGKEYATAMALLALEVPNRLLPIFQR